MTKRKRALIINLSIVAGAVLFRIALAVGASATGGPKAISTANLPVQSGHVTVTISNREYHPTVLVITTSTTVTWVNHDPMAHTVTEGQHASATPQGFNSGLLASGQSWTHTFQTPGTFAYTCIFHPDMNAHIVIKQRQ